MIRLEHVKKSYGNVTPLKDADATINRGDVISVIGPSGTGKSTLLRMINALENVTDGHILIDGVDVTDSKNNIPALRQKVGMVFQSFNLFEHLTVIENIMKPQIDILGRDRQTAYDKGATLLKQVGLFDKALQYPNNLSGGQKQRVAIARTLAMDPEVILFDEPTSALDPRMVTEVETVIQNLSDMGKTMLIVTHDMRFAENVSNRVFYMDEGLIYEDGPTEQIFHNPLKEKTRQFIYSQRALVLKLENDCYDFAEMQGKISMYAYTNQIDFNKQNRIFSIFEELCRQILSPKGALPAQFSLVADGDGAHISIVCDYGIAPFSVMDTENELALKLLLHSAPSLEYEELSEDSQYKNRVKITL